ncbi:hypothetical protein [Paenibacillus sp. PL2-23]|uniref:hypothetical protein n=1 Tax=Paenibacillus sp. PL2-23 TaxID=2100729 RepID=UPI0030FC203A
MRKLRMLPIAVTVIISAASLFGGWTLYKEVAVASPLTKTLEELPGVVDAGKPKIGQSKLAITLQLSKEADLQEVYASASEQAGQSANGKALDISIVTEEDPLLEEIWQSALFDIAEAMETKTYSAIPATMENAVSARAGVSAETAMDNAHVYVTLRSEKGAKFIVLPRTPNQLGVWTNA